METIIFLRHGQAEDDDGSGDAARPLTEKGVHQAEAAGRALRSLGLIPDLCLSSPRERAIETARGACLALDLEPVIDQGLGIGEFRADELAAGLGTVLLTRCTYDWSLRSDKPTMLTARLPVVRVTQPSYV